jgi:NAD(P)-dependent dehydrogenase (short-subunit alcohol dehydrogenase family)
MAVEGKPYGIKVNALMPAAFTRMSALTVDEEVGAWLKQNLPPALVAPLAVWLVHEDVPCTGEIFSGSGGRSARVLLAEVNDYQAKEHTLEELRDHFKEVIT